VSQRPPPLLPFSLTVPTETNLLVLNMIPPPPSERKPLFWSLAGIFLSVLLFPQTPPSRIGGGGIFSDWWRGVLLRLSPSPPPPQDRLFFFSLKKLFRQRRSTGARGLTGEEMFLDAPRPFAPLARTKTCSPMRALPFPYFRNPFIQVIIS